MATLDAKTLNLDITRGNTLEQEAEKYGYSPEKFTEILHKNFSKRAANSFIRSLNRNNTHKGKSPKFDINSEQVQTEISTAQMEAIHLETCDYSSTEVHTTDTSQHYGENTSEVEVPNADTSHSYVKDTSEAEASNINASESCEETSQSLENEIQELSAEIRRLESLKETYRKSKNQSLSDIQNLYTRLEALKHQIEEIKECLAGAMALYSNSEKSIEQLKAEIVTAEEKLKTAYQKQELFKSVTIYACGENGTEIDCRQKGIKTFEPSAFSQETYDRIANSGSAENVRIKDVKYVAALLEYCDILKEEHRFVTIVFEDAELQALFDEFGNT